MKCYHSFVCCCHIWVLSERNLTELRQTVLQWRSRSAIGELLCQMAAGLPGTFTAVSFVMSYHVIWSQLVFDSANYHDKHHFTVHIHTYTVHFHAFPTVRARGTSHFSVINQVPKKFEYLVQTQTVRILAEYEMIDSFSLFLSYIFVCSIGSLHRNVWLKTGTYRRSPEILSHSSILLLKCHDMLGLVACSALLFPPSV